MSLGRSLLLILAFAWAGAAQAEVAATVVFATGSGSVIAADGRSRPAVRGGEVAAGDLVDTVDGRIQLRFRDGASMSLQPATRFRVDDYRFSGPGGADDRGFFSLLKGGLRTITGLIGKTKREQYRVGTVVATIGIRGTEYSARLGDDGLRVSTQAGLVEVCNEGGCTLVKPGETALATEPGVAPQLLGAGVSADEALPATPPPTPAPTSPHSPDVPANSPGPAGSPGPGGTSGAAGALASPPTATGGTTGGTGLRGGPPK